METKAVKVPANPKRTPPAYVQKGVTTEITAVSRVSVKIKDNFYTFEFSETRSMPKTANLAKEKELLWEECHSQVDAQLRDVLELNANKR